MTCVCVWHDSGVCVCVCVCACVWDVQVNTRDTAGRTPLHMAAAYGATPG